MDDLGAGVLAVWNDVAVEAEAEFNAWYEQEHLAERLAIPGFLRARRWWNAGTSPRYFTFYEVADADVLKSDVYLKALGNPSRYTRAIMPSFRNTVRSACRVTKRLRTADGGHAAVTRLTPEAGKESTLSTWLAGEALPRIMKAPGVMAVQLWQSDQASTQTRAFESTLRPGGDQTIAWAVVIESTRAEESVSGDAILSEAKKLGAGRVETPQRYALLSARTR
jgi:hypothetical protein